jgi:hypothetical protein
MQVRTVTDCQFSSLLTCKGGAQNISRLDEGIELLQSSSSELKVITGTGSECRRVECVQVAQGRLS